MKKTIVAILFAIVATTSMAADVSVTAVHDYKLNASGARATVSVGEVAGVTPQASVTRIDGQFTRYAVGGKYNFASVGKVTFAGVASGVYQNSVRPTGSGYGVSAGLLASLPVTKNMSVDATVERFVGQNRVFDRNSTVASLGLNVKF